MAGVNHLWFHLFVFMSVVALSISDDPDCVYTFYIRTGSIWRGGTHSKISATFFDKEGYGLLIRNIVSWGGQMGQGYDYFERGSLNIFSGRGTCLPGPVCALNLTSDGTGSGHGWYVNYLELTTTGVHLTCAQQLFTVEQWLATDASPYKLWAYVDNCGSKVTMKDDSRTSSRSPSIIAVTESPVSLGGYF